MLSLEKTVIRILMRSAVRKRAWSLLLAFGVSTIGLPLVHQLQHVRWGAGDKPVSVIWQQQTERYRLPDPCSLYASLHSLVPVCCTMSIAFLPQADLPTLSLLSPTLPVLSQQPIRAPPSWG